MVEIYLGLPGIFIYLVDISKEVYLPVTFWSMSRCYWLQEHYQCDRRNGNGEKQAWDERRDEKR